MSRRFARPYAKALLNSLRGEETAQGARDQMARFVEALDAVPDLGRMAMSPGVPPDVKCSIVSEVCELLEIRGTARNLLLLTTRNYRLLHLADVLDAIDESLRRELGVVVAEVTSAQPLDEGQRERLEQVLAQRLDRRVDLSLKTDPKLLAGFVARIGSQRYDASLSGQLGRLAETLAEGRT